MPKNNKDFFKIKNRWSEIKDKLLGGYLVEYFIVSTNYDVF